LSRDLGDFQTPLALVAAVLDELGPIGRRWPRVLEPTCGRGNFLAGLLGRNEPPREVIGIEIQDDHAAAARATALARAKGTPEVAVAIVRASLFDLDLRRDLAWRQHGPLLVIGNPPWVTSAELGVLASENLPPKWNVKGARGLDARTGAANFDIAEAVWLKLIDELTGGDNDEPATIALLCKMSVARNVLEHAQRRTWPVARASLTRIDARRWFGAEVEACLFRLTLEPGPGARVDRVPVFAALGATAPASELGFARGRLVADVSEFPRWTFADGTCPLAWRQGVKHDAAAVMELVLDLDPDGAPGSVRNKQGAAVDVEPAFLYPLLKGTDLARSESESEPYSPRPRRAVIVTQTRIGQDTRALEQAAPRLWTYLMAHAAALARRKSSIYRGQPPFAIFGIGPYSFAPYKVAVSGLHKTPRFRVIGPVAGQPVMLDDTCYFLACATPEQAALVAAILDEEAVRGFLRCLAFPGAKRPITKAILQRLDLAAIAERAERAALVAHADAVYRRLLGADAHRAAPLAWPAAFDSLVPFTRQGSAKTEEDTPWPLPPSTTTAVR
jgi:hypothetical protein